MCFHCLMFPVSALLFSRSFFHNSCKASLMSMNPLLLLFLWKSLYLSFSSEGQFCQKVFLIGSFLSTFWILCHFLLSLKVSVEKSTVCIELHLYITNLLSLAAFKILSLSLNFDTLILMFHHVSLLGFIFGTFWASGSGILLLFPG